MIKIIIAGGRDFTDAEAMIDALNGLESVLGDTSNWIIVAGMASGADITGYNLAVRSRVATIQMPAEWDKHPNKSAGFVRNGEMAAIADVLVAFWDGRSKGTEHMIKTMRKREKPVYVFKYLGDPHV
jgi:hypothetical protein